MKAFEKPALERQWLPLNALRAFEAAGRHLSFTAAAGSLRVAQSAVSRHVIVLERFLGVPLFERRPQQLALTEAGKHLLPVVTRCFDRIDQTLAEIVEKRGNPKQVLRVALPPTLAQQLAVPLLRGFRAAHGDLILEIASATFPDGEGEADLAIVYSEPRVCDAVDDLLWMERLTLLCSPEVAARASGPERLVASADLLHVRSEGRSRYHMWELFARATGLSDMAVRRGLVFDTARLAVEYAMSGDGLALVDLRLFREEVASGRLVAPLEASVESGFGYFLVTAPEDLGNEAVGLFRSWLINGFTKASFKPERA